MKFSSDELFETYMTASQRENERISSSSSFWYYKNKIDCGERDGKKSNLTFNAEFWRGRGYIVKDCAWDARRRTSHLCDYVIFKASLSLFLCVSRTHPYRLRVVFPVTSLFRAFFFFRILKLLKYIVVLMLRDFYGFGKALIYTHVYMLSNADKIVEIQRSYLDCYSSLTLRAYTILRVVYLAARATVYI